MLQILLQDVHVLEGSGIIIEMHYGQLSKFFMFETLAKWHEYSNMQVPVQYYYDLETIRP